MEARYLNAFIAGVKEVLGGYGIEVQFERPRLMDKTQTFEHSIVVIYGFTGSSKGRIVFSFDESGVAEILSKIPGEKSPDNGTDFKKSKLFEICNLVMNNSINKLSEDGTLIDTTFSFAIAGDLMQPKSMKSKTIGIPFIFKDGGLILSLSIENNES
jgi:CheY-specific phosphatase CheX